MLSKIPFRENYIMKSIEPKQTLSITIPITLYQRLQQEVGKGKISKFIKETVEEK